MNLFRSEERIEQWLGAREPGATIPVTKLGELNLLSGQTVFVAAIVTLG